MFSLPLSFLIYSPVLTTSHWSQSNFCLWLGELYWINIYRSVPNTEQHTNCMITFSVSYWTENILITWKILQWTISVQFIAYLNISTLVPKIKFQYFSFVSVCILIHFWEHLSFMTKPIFSNVKWWFQLKCNHMYLRTKAFGSK